MEYILSAGQMKDADAHMIQKIGIPSLVLMERAALACINVMKDRGIDLSRPLVVCGSGNNGGDGFAIARLLLEDGYTPQVVFAGRMESRSEETKLQMDILKKLGVSYGNCLPDREYSVIIDAVFGIGLTRPLEGKYKEIIEKMNACGGVKVAVDIPSGVSADTGMVLGTAFCADLTVTFAYRKRGQILYPGSNYCGDVVTASVGINDPGLRENQDAVFTLDREDVLCLLPKRPADSNKGTFGKVLLIAGSRGMSGAAYLSARAAYAAGAGLVRIFTEESNRVILQQLLPEAIMTTYCRDEEEEACEALTGLLDWADVIAIGCGLGMEAPGAALIRTVLEGYSGPCVVDADALNILSEHEDLKALLKSTGADCILTPHIKEMSRLTGTSVEELKNLRAESLRKFVEGYPVVCIMKDARTMAAKKGRKMYLNVSGNSALAKGGSGDVLAGMTAGFLAQGVSCFHAAVISVYIHGLAGETAGRKMGLRSVLAGDIIDGIGETLKSLEEQNEEIQQSACSY